MVGPRVAHRRMTTWFATWSPIRVVARTHQSRSREVSAVPSGRIRRLSRPVRHRSPTPGRFVIDLFTLDGTGVHQAISATAEAWRNPPGTLAGGCDCLAGVDLPISAAHCAAEDRVVQPRSDGSERCSRAVEMRLTADQRRAPAPPVSTRPRTERQKRHVRRGTQLSSRRDCGDEALRPGCSFESLAALRRYRCAVAAGTSFSALPRRVRPQGRALSVQGS